MQKTLGKDHTLNAWTQMSIIFNFKSSIIYIIFAPVLFFAVYTALLIALFNQVDIEAKVPTTIISSISVVLGLLLVFRTNSAYDRYYEGSKLWSNIKSNLQNIMRTIASIKLENRRDFDDKVEAIKLSYSFALATKLFLRNEHVKKFHEVAPHLPTSITKSQYINRPSDSTSFFRDSQLLVNIGVDETLIDENTGLFHFHFDEVNTNLLHLPLEILHLLDMYFIRQIDKEYITPNYKQFLTLCLNNLTLDLNSLERIMRIPIPMAYEIHLKQVLFLYCSFIPFTFLYLGYYAIVLISIISFTLFGIEGIGEEIENPFGYDDNDLPLDHFCDEIKYDAAVVISKAKSAYSKLDVQ